MHGYSRLGGAGRSPPPSPRFRHGRSKNGSWNSSKESNSMEKLVFILMSAVFRRRGLLLFAPLLYISGMLLYMGSFSFDVVSIKNGVVLVHKRAPPGSVYRSPQVFEKLWPFMEAEAANSNNGTGNVLMKAWTSGELREWRPCANRSVPEAELPKSNGFLIIEANGGLNQQRLSICDAVAVAGLLNATLLIPIFHLNSVWRDSSYFGDIFDENFFIQSLGNHVHVVKEIPVDVLERFDNNISNIVNLRVKGWSSSAHYLQKVLPQLLEMGAVRIAPFSNRLAQVVPSKIQRLRCFANFGALRFSEPIQALAENMVDRMIKHSSQSGGKYVSVHLRFEEDMVAFSCCEYDGGEEEKHEMDIARERSWRGKFKRKHRIIKPGANRVDGRCPLTPLEDLATGKTILTAKEQSGLYLLETNDQSTTNILSLQATSETWAKSQIWLHHKRLGHPSFNLIKSLFPHLFTNDSVESFNCDICQLSKHHRASYPISNKKSTSPFDLIHTDVWGPVVASISGAKWFVIFIDDCTRVTWTYLMNNKSEVFQIFVKFFHLVQNQFEKNIKRIRSDNGTEYVNHEFLNFFSHNGIVHELTCVNTPQQNGIAERKNRHLLEVTRALLFQMSVPKSYWGEAVLTATYLINRLPTRILNGISPIESLLSFVPSSPLISSLPSRIFGCIAFVHSHHPNRSKLDPKALKCIFIGYPSNKKGYKCYHPQSRRIFISMDVTFHETQSFYVSSPLQGEKTLEVDELSFLSLPCQSSQDAQDLSNETIRIHNKDEEEDRFFGQKYERRKQPTSTLEQEKLSNPEVRIPEDNIEEVSITDDLPIALRKERRSCAKYPISQHVCTNNLSDKHRSFIAAIDTTKIPTSIQEAMKLEHWTQAMKEEMNALERNSTWEIVDKPKDKKAVGCRWIFTVKHKADGTIERYKARLVAKGYTQTYGIDYEETFAPVAKMNTVRVILALAAHFRWDLHQLDVKNAFLHGDLEEEVYMDIPPGFEVKNEQNKVCLLKKALYGLKQSPRAWFGRFTKAMISLGYRQSQGDHTLFIKHSSTGKLTLLLVYVDDMIIAGDDEAEKLALKEKLASQFEMKDLGKLKYFLGIEVAYSKEGIFISQRKYVLDLLKETGKLGCRTSTIPIEQNHRIGSEESAPVEKTQYQRLVGKLIYLSHTRPDIAYAVSVVSQFMHDPRNRHMQAVDKILQYLKSSPGKGLLFKREDTLSMKIYTDADYAGSITDRKSTSGYCMFLGNSLVTWRSKKQDRVSRSSAEAEFRALAQGMCEGLWMKIIFDDLKIKMDSPVQLYCDNKSAISIAHNPVQHDRTKHIEIDRHFIKDNLDRGFMIATHVPTGLQLADIFTKGLPQGRFQDLVNKLGMIDIHLPT